MDETLHFYIDSLHRTDTHHISTTKTRLWPSIIASQRWIFKHNISGSTLMINGIGLMVINSLAIAAEGFLTDILVEYLDNHELEKSDKIKQIENSNWNSKVKIYNTTFENCLNKCESYESIDILLLLRNNTAHGRTHTERNAVSIATSESSKIESINKNYQKARQFFERINLMKESEVFSNIDTLWQIKHAWFFLSQVRLFLYSVLEKNKSEKFNSIKSELDNAFKMTI